MSERPICSHCHHEIHPSDTARHFGSSVAHQEYRCLDLLRTRIAELERERDEALKNNESFAKSYGDDQTTIARQRALLQRANKWVEPCPCPAHADDEEHKAEALQLHNDIVAELARR